jgi:hypothetical protein
MKTGLRIRASSGQGTLTTEDTERHRGSQRKAEKKE